MERLTIGLDIDGVIIDYISAILPLLSEICNRPLIRDDITHTALTRILDIDEETSEQIWELILGTDLLQTSPPVKGAVEGVAALSRHEIWLITGRPASVQDLTTAWLADNGVKYDRIIFDSGKMVGNLSPERQCNVFVEDLLEVANLLADAGVYTLLFNQPWNQSDMLPENCHRVYDWDTIVRMINRLEQGVT